MPDDTSISPREAAIWIVQGLLVIAAVFVSSQLILDQFPGWFGIEVLGTPRWIVLCVVLWAAWAIATRPIRKRLERGKPQGRKDGI